MIDVYDRYVITNILWLIFQIIKLIMILSNLQKQQIIIIILLSSDNILNEYQIVKF